MVWLLVLCFMARNKNSGLFILMLSSVVAVELVPTMLR